MASERPNPRAGFSLVEVTMAIGVAAVAVVSVVALYRPIVLAVADVTALEEAAEIERKLEALWAGFDFEGKQAAVDAGTRFFASRDGAVIAAPADAAWAAYGATAGERDAAKVYEAVFRRDTTLSPASEPFPAAIHVTLHLAWPAHRRDGSRVTDPDQQQHRFVPMVFNR